MTTPIRIWRLSGANCYGDDIATALEAASDQALEAICQAGFTGIWVTARLRDISCTDVFPKLGTHASLHQTQLLQLVKRCQTHPLKVYVYLNEPRGFCADDPFWEDHPQVKGALGSCVMEHWDRSFALCTSTTEKTTLAFLQQGCANLFAAVPGLGGVVCITASESHTHCYSHFETQQTGIGAHHGQKPGDVLACPACRDRLPREIIAQVIGAIQQGVHRANPKADVIAWSWSWNMYEQPPQQQLISLLPKSVILMSDFERGGALVYQGHRLPVDEYSLNYIGPSDLCRNQFATGRELGLRVMARTQFNHTIEMATAPNLPLITNLTQKLFALKQLSGDDVMATWSFGCTIDTLNVFTVQQFYQRQPEPAQEQVFLEQVAKDYFGLQDGQPTVAAWQGLCDAMQAYPFTLGFLYFSPFNCSLVYPLINHDPRTRSMKVWNFDSHGLGDCLEQTLEPLTLKQLLDRLAALHKNWSASVTLYKKGLAGALETKHATQESNVAQYIEHLIHSIWVIYSWFAWRYEPGTIPGLDTKTITQRLALELDNLQQAETLVASDGRLGFYEESQAYFVTPQEIAAKRVSVVQLLDTIQSQPADQSV